jgi:hypothetical protein
MPSLLSEWISDAADCYEDSIEYSLIEGTREATAELKTRGWTTDEIDLAFGRLLSDALIAGQAARKGCHSPVDLHLAGELAMSLIEEAAGKDADYIERRFVRDRTNSVYTLRYLDALPNPAPFRPLCYLEGTVFGDPDHTPIVFGAVWDTLKIPSRH